MKMMGNNILKMKYWKYVATLMLLMAWTAPTMAQTDYSGYYYIACYRDYDADNVSNRYYLVPASNGGDQSISISRWAWNDDPETPYLTTHKDGQCAETVWLIEKVGDYYYFSTIHNSVKKYVVFRRVYTDGDSHRKTMHLEQLDSPEDADSAKFVITKRTNGNYNIQPKDFPSGWGSNKYWTPSGGNTNYYYGTGSSPKYYSGLIGLYTNPGDVGQQWVFEDASVATPTINFDNTTNMVTIECATSSATIYYTINGGPQNAYNGTGGTGPFEQDTPATIRTFASFNGVSSTELVYNLQQVATPVIQNVNNAISITTATEGATIHYTTDNSDPTTSSTEYSGPLTENVSGRPIKAIAVKENQINSGIAGPVTITLQCAAPVVHREDDGFRLTCDFPTSGVTIYYTTMDGSQPSTSSPTVSSGGFVTCTFPVTVRAFATATNYNPSAETQVTMLEDLSGSGTAVDPYLIQVQDHVAVFVWKAGTDDGASAWYKVTSPTPLDFSGAGSITRAFSGHFDGNFCTLTGLSHALFNTVDGGTVKNVTFKDVNIQSGDNDGDAGAICNKAMGSSRIYNCGILPTEITRDEDGNITGFSGSSVSGTRYVGGFVGLLSGTARVINCYSYANVSGGNIAAGIVGNNNETTTMSSLNTMVMNCMFYGNITVASDASTMKPVYGGNIISNAGAEGVNNYNYYRNGKGVTFDDNYASFGDYYCSLPADEEYLTRYEYYRSILNCNRKLCVWWITGHTDADQTAEDGEMMAKWVLDPEIAPFPILKKWGKYPSVINQDKTRVWDPRTKDADGNSLTPHWVNRSEAPDYQGKQLGTISVTVNAGAKHAGSGETSTTLSSVIVMDMDTLNHDYCYAKIQLPYYNELFGDPTKDATDHWDDRYGGNYKEYVVTGWKITSITGGTAGSFKGYAVSSVPQATGSVSAGTVTPDDISSSAWEDGFNFADRNCTNKDRYSKSGRVFAQGGYYYVPEGVSAITIEAYWGKAVYLHNKNHYLDRVNVAAVADGDGEGDNTGPDFGSDFTPAGTLSTTFQGYQVKDNLQDAISALTNDAGYTVYDQAIVLVGNVQVKNRGGSLNNGGSRAFTIMSCDLDLDNEPDYCLQFQTRNTTNRPSINPARFDFLPVPELGLAIRTNTFAYAIGIMVPKGHFEITETAFMHTTQFEYDADVNKVEAPLILNGGHFEQIVLRRGPKNKTSYIIMGGNFRMKRFTPGYHASNIEGGAVRHCVVNAIGGEYPEFYLSGIYRPNQATLDNDNPHCYTNGGHFGLVAGAGYEQVKGNVTFKIDHSIIREFYGGGINGAKPVTGTIDVTVNNSLVGKYCGGPKVGQMSAVNGVLKTVTTNATGTTFGVFYGGGNGGTSYYRDPKYDNTREFPTTVNGWITPSGNYTPKFKEFTPLNQESEPAADYSDILGYHAKYEFEVFNASNGLKSSDDVIRLYYHWAQFGTTTTGDVTNTLTNCTITGDFFGGGNMGNVTGNVTSTLKGITHVYGSAFAAGYSASIPSFPAHDKSTVRFPTKDKSGNVDEQGSLDYYQDNGEDRMYTWCYKNTTTGTVLPEGVVIPSGYDVGLKQKSAFRYPDEDGGKWYILTNVSLENLGAVSGNATLTIEDNSVIDNNVFGGGDSSAVNGSTTVILQEGAKVLGNVFGGGNEGPVGGNSEVIVQDSPTISGTTPFTESTQVTITGPLGAVIRYTTNGDTPTAASTVYNVAFTLTATTTVKAIAITNGVISPVATKTFTKQ